MRVALGGVRDEARSAAIAAPTSVPCRAASSTACQAGWTIRYVADELDKLDSDWRGSPAAALMEVLDPAHNHAFRDNYLEVEYDLSRVFFVATANDVDAIPETLYDRLEVIHLSGYVAESLIARRHLLPPVAKDAGLRRGDVSFPRRPADDARGYTREAGVRELERAHRASTVRSPASSNNATCQWSDRGDDLRYLGEAHWLDALTAAARQGGSPPASPRRTARGAHHQARRPRARRAGAHRPAGEIMQESGAAGVICLRLTRAAA